MPYNGKIYWFWWISMYANIIYEATEKDLLAPGSIFGN